MIAGSMIRAHRARVIPVIPGRAMLYWLDIGASSPCAWPHVQSVWSDEELRNCGDAEMSKIAPPPQFAACSSRMRSLIAAVAKAHAASQMHSGANRACTFILEYPNPETIRLGKARKAKADAQTFHGPRAFQKATIAGQRVAAHTATSDSIAIAGLIIISQLWTHLRSPRFTCQLVDERAWQSRNQRAPT